MDWQTCFRRYLFPERRPAGKISGRDLATVGWADSQEHLGAAQRRGSSEVCASSRRSRQVNMYRLTLATRTFLLSFVPICLLLICTFLAIGDAIHQRVRQDL